MGRRREGAGRDWTCAARSHKEGSSPEAVEGAGP